MEDRRTRRQSRASLAAVAFGALASALALAPAARCAALPLEGVAGWEGDRQAQGYGFATVGTAPPAGARWSVPARVTGSYLYYDYESAGEEIRVRAPGVGGLVGLRATGARGSIALLAGGETRWERREKSGAATPGAVARAGVVVQGEATLAIGSRLRPFVLGNYSGSARYVYCRAELNWQCTNLDWGGPVAWFVGLEGAVQGNADTDGTQAGGSLGCSLTRPRVSFGLHGGYKETRSPEGARRDGAYLGASLYRRF